MFFKTPVAFIFPILLASSFAQADTTAVVTALQAEHSAGALDHDYFTVGSIEMHQVGSVQAPAVHIAASPKSAYLLHMQRPMAAPELSALKPNDDEGASTGSTGNEELDTIINLGEKVWAFVVANAPVANTNLDVSANALPENVKSWSDLQGWQAPTGDEYAITIKNLYGMTVLTFNYQVLFTPGGNLNGQGLYINNVEVVPTLVTVAWGWKFNATATVENVTNAGTAANPVAAIQLGVSWKLDSVLSHEAQANSYYMRGDGQIKAL